MRQPGKSLTQILTQTRKGIQPDKLNPLLLLVRLAGFEPATYGLEVRCSIQLSYRRTYLWHVYNIIARSRSQGKEGDYYSQQTGNSQAILGIEEAQSSVKRNTGNKLMIWFLRISRRET